jgi:hypothetical protein
MALSCRNNLDLCEEEAPTTRIHTAAAEMQRRPLQARSPQLDGQDMPFYVLPRASRRPSPAAAAPPACAQRTAAGAPAMQSAAAQHAPMHAVLGNQAQQVSPSSGFSRTGNTPSGEQRAASPPQQHLHGSHASPQAHLRSAGQRSCDPDGHLRPPAAATAARQARSRGHKGEQTVQSQRSPAHVASQRPRSAREVYTSGSQQRLHAMDMLARTVHACGDTGRDVQHDVAGSGSRCVSAPLDATRAERFDRHLDAALRSRCTLPAEHGARSGGTDASDGAQGNVTEGLQQIERSSARLRRQAAAYQALEGYERQLAAELTVLQRSLQW